MTLAPLTGTAWDALLDSYVEATISASHRASRARTTARAQRAVEAVIDFARWTGATPETITYAAADRWLRRSGPRPRPEKLERRAITDVLDHAVARGQLDRNPMRALDDWTALLDGYAAAGLATESSVESFRRRTMRFARWAAVPPARVDEDLLVRYLAQPGWSDATRAAARRSLAVVLRFAADAGLLERNPAELLPGYHAAVGDGRPWERIAVAAGAARDHHGETPHVDARAFASHPAIRWAEATGRDAPRECTGGRPSPSLLEAWRLDGSPVVTFLDDPVTAAWDRLFVSYAVRAAAAGRQASSLKQRCNAIARFARWAAVPPCDVDEGLLVRYLANPDWKPEYRRSTRAALRMVFRHAYKAGFTTHDPAAELDSVRVPVGAPRPTPEAAISAALKGLPMRERLMVLIAGLAGCRRAEIAVLRVADITEDGLHITGKGGKERVVPIHPALGPELAAWLRISGITAGYLFPGETDGHLSPHRVGQLVSRALPGSWATHSLRHRFGSRAYAGAFDLRAVQELLGHSSPATTARYVAVPNTALVNAVAAVPPIPGMGTPPALDDEDQGEEESA